VYQPAGIGQRQRQPYKPSGGAQAQASQSAATAAVQSVDDDAARSPGGALDTLGQQTEATNTDVSAFNASGGRLDDDAQAPAETPTDPARAEAEAKGAAPGDGGRARMQLEWPATLPVSTTATAACGPPSLR
jgi:hypothetical protein